MPPPDLEPLARAFADSITRILNLTVTDGLRLSAVIPRTKGLVFVGHRLTRHQLVFKLQLDPEGRSLKVGSSSFGVYESSDAVRLHHCDEAFLAVCVKPAESTRKAVHQQLFRHGARTRVARSPDCVDPIEERRSQRIPAAQ